MASLKELLVEAALSLAGAKPAVSLGVTAPGGFLPSSAPRRGSVLLAPAAAAERFMGSLDARTSTPSGGRTFDNSAKKQLQYGLNAIK